MALRRSLLVAATTRTSTEMSLSDPTREIFCSCRARRTLAWAPALMSPTSSKNKVPPWACSNFPRRCETALVNAPFSWPNNSLSINSEGIAAQLTSTNGPSARPDPLWICLATSSLPDPLAPVTNTRASVGATVSTMDRISRMPSESPTIAWDCAPWTFFLSTLVVSTSASLSSMFLKVTSTLLRSRGFWMKSYAPFFKADTAVSTVPWPEIMTTGAATSFLANMSKTSKPSICGILTSQKMPSKGFLVANTTPSMPVDASATSCPSYSKISRRLFRMGASSSIKSRCAMLRG